MNIIEMVLTLEQDICCQRGIWADYEYLKIEDMKLLKHSIDHYTGEHTSEEYRFSYFDTLTLDWKAVVPKRNP